MFLLILLKTHEVQPMGFVATYFPPGLTPPISQPIVRKAPIPIGAVKVLGGFT